MDVLILGGTRFVGRNIVEAFAAAGHTVSILTRGKSADQLSADVERLRGDRNDGIAGYNALNHRKWHACVDVCGYTPKQVRPVADLLRSTVGRYVFISTMSVYTNSPDRPRLETHPLLPPAAEDETSITNETYGPLKVTCENIIQEIYGERCTLIRPQIVAGPYDPTNRYAHWVKLAMQEAEFLAPGDGSDHLQVIDARDLARFVLRAVEKEISGTFNLAGPRITWEEFMSVLQARNFSWLSAEAIEQTAGTDVPLYVPDDSPWSGVMNASSQRALAAGLTLTDPAVTAADTRAWLSDLPDSLSSRR